MEDDQIVDLNGLRYEGLSARQSLPQLIDFCHVKAPLSLRRVNPPTEHTPQMNSL